VTATSMSRIRRNTVQIVNPALGGAQYTSTKSARQFVRRGIAAFEGGDGAIRFVDQKLRERHPPNGDCSDEFRWRFGITGGMAQVVASRIAPIPISGVLKKGGYE